MGDFNLHLRYSNLKSVDKKPTISKDQKPCITPPNKTSSINTSLISMGSQSHLSDLSISPQWVNPAVPSMSPMAPPGMMPPYDMMTPPSYPAHHPYSAQHHYGAYGAPVAPATVYQQQNLSFEDYGDYKPFRVPFSGPNSIERNPHAMIPPTYNNTPPPPPPPMLMAPPVVAPPPPPKIDIRCETVLIRGDKVAISESSVDIVICPVKNLLVLRYGIITEETGTDGEVVVKPQVVAIDASDVTRMQIFSWNTEWHVVTWELNESVATKLPTSENGIEPELSNKIVFSFGMDPHYFQYYVAYTCDNIMGMNVNWENSAALSNLILLKVYRLEELPKKPDPPQEIRAQPSNSMEKPIVTKATSCDAALISSDDEPASLDLNIVFADSSTYRMSIETLKKNTAPRSWINDVMVDFYVQYMTKNLLNDEGRDDVHIFDTTFFQRLYKFRPQLLADYEGQGSLELPRLLDTLYPPPKRANRQRKLPPFDKKLIVIPIFWENHWLLVMVQNVRSVMWPHLTDWNGLDANNNENGVEAAAEVESTTEIGSTPTTADLHADSDLGRAMAVGSEDCLGAISVKTAILSPNGRSVAGGGEVQAGDDVITTDMLTDAMAEQQLNDHDDDDDDAGSELQLMIADEDDELSSVGGDAGQLDCVTEEGPENSLSADHPGVDGGEGQMAAGKAVSSTEHIPTDIPPKVEKKKRGRKPGAAAAAKKAKVKRVPVEKPQEPKGPSIQEFLASCDREEIQGLLEEPPTCRIIIMDSKMHDPPNVEILARIHASLFKMIRTWIRMMVACVGDGQGQLADDRFSTYRCYRMPNQPNSFDCGMFMLSFIEHFACRDRTWMDLPDSAMEELDIGVPEAEYQQQVAAMRTELHQLVLSLAKK